MQDTPPGTSAKLLSYLSYGLALLSVLLAGFFFIEGSNQGFPDGYKSDFSKAIEKLFPICGVLALLFGVLFGYWGKNYRQNHWYKKAGLTFLLWVVFILAVLTVNDYLYANLDHGQGG